ncbi:hypothetical protein ANCCAN_12726 [Ancylostoma caninum]|uniref:MULE transposase domain-containing protein n=1 Tax=Ancylostoma caninum TaxID=29170 RepID=A0A368GAA8_ANCCA|nr:hypothetical protein ANCCAN_12726 [Ancylostoma caninum]
MFYHPYFFFRSVNAQKRNVNMAEVPDDLRLLPEGSDFLQLQQPDMHIYYSKELIKLACDNGLQVLVGDGVHKLNPRNTPVRMDKGQLYTIHAVCNGETEVPILYAVTRSKTKATYRTIFRKLKEELTQHGAVDGIRIVLDFEKVKTTPTFLGDFYIIPYSNFSQPLMPRGPSFLKLLFKAARSIYHRRGTENVQPWVFDALFEDQESCGVLQDGGASSKG